MSSSVDKFTHDPITYQGSTFEHCCLEDSDFNAQGSREHLYASHNLIHNLVEPSQ